METSDLPSQVNEDGCDPPSSVEEVRKKRLAYFSANRTSTDEKKECTYEPEEQVWTAGQASTVFSKKTSVPVPPGNDSGNPEQKQYNATESHLITSKNSQLLIPKHSSNYASQSHYYNGGNAFASNTQATKVHDSISYPQPHQSFEPNMRPDGHRYPLGMNQLSIDRSEEYDRISVFNSVADYNELGLSTHRPESTGGMSDRSISREFYKSYEQGRTAEDVFGGKSAAEMRAALGDRGFEELMLKVNQNLGVLQRGRMAVHRAHELKTSGDQTELKGQGELPSRSSSVDSMEKRQRMPTALSPRHRIHSSNSQNSLRASTVTRNINQLKDGEKEVLTLVRNYDQVTVPRNTKNTYSADEIYREAFGTHPDLSSSLDSRPAYMSAYHQAWGPPWADRNTNSGAQSDRSNPPLSPKRRLSHDSVPVGSQPGFSPYHPYHQGPFSYPPPPVHHPPSYESHFANGIPPPSPTQAVPASPYSPHDGAFYFSHQHSYRSPASGQHPHHTMEPQQFYSAAISNQSFMPPSPSAAPPSSVPPFFYPPHQMSNPQVLKFPTNGVPLHLPPPPIPHPYKHQGNVSQYSLPHQFAPSSTRRGSLTHYGQSGFQGQEGPVSGFLKVPHPPPNPPALKGKEELSEHRRTASSGHHIVPQSGGEEANSYNLQRYFSSLELYDRAATDPSPAPLPNTSRSVEGDYCKTENDDDDTQSAFTSVTGVTTASKAGGVTQRLLDLGMDLDHLRHLRVVDKKADQELEDLKFERLSKGIRYCPECGASNKAYMDWCTECGEVIIGVEPTLPLSKKKQIEEKERRRKSSSNKIVAGQNQSKLSNGNGSSQKIEEVEGAVTSSGYFPKDSPESGRGLSLSSSPVRYRREQEEVGEPKDSGRASSGDMRERAVHSQSDGELPENGDCEGIEQENAREADKMNEDFYDQISDPVLKEFIISYRNRQNSKDVSDNGGVASFSYNAERTSPTKAKYQSAHLKNEKKSQSEWPSSTSNIDWEASNSVTKKDVSGNKSMAENVRLPAENSIACPNGEVEIQEKESLPSKKVSKKGSGKKKKRKGVMMDVEIFGYEETRLSRDSTRGHNLVPLLNLACSSDESDDDDDDDDDDEESSEDNDDHNNKDESSGDNILVNGVQNDFSVLNEEEEDEENDFSTASSSQGLSGSQTKSQSSKSTKAKVKVPNRSMDSPQTNSRNRGGSAGKTGAAPISSSTPARSAGQPPNMRASWDQGSQRARGGRGVPANYQRHWARSSVAWSSYNPRELSTRSSLSMPSPQAHSNGRPSSAGTGQVSKVANASGGRNNGTSAIPVRQRPSSAEYNQRRRPEPEPKQRPSSATVRPSQRMSQTHSNPDLAHNASTAAAGASRYSQNRPASARQSTSTETRNRNSDPNDAGQRARSGAGVSATSTVTASSQDKSSDGDSPRVMCAEVHRLPLNELTDEQQTEKLHAVAKAAYDKFQEMTPRIDKGELSMWQCLPNEIWFYYVFKYLSQGDLCRLMMASSYFYCLANDESLWRYITVKQRFPLTDSSLTTIARHNPVSVAMVKCQGGQVTLNGLHNFFQNTRSKLKELNICGCSQGCLVGATVLNVAANYCQRLTHLDASFCNVNEESFTAMSECAERLESVCVNGFQSMSDSALNSLLTKHGKSLHTLELYACFSLTASAMRSIGEHCTALKRLCLGSCNKLTDSMMITLSTHLARIEELDLRGCKNLRNDCIRKVVRNCPRIHTLVLANCQQISDIAVTEIATYLKNTLMCLDVCGCDNISDQGIVTLAKNCDRLTTLDIGSTRCTGSSMYQLASNSCSRWLETVKLSFLSSVTEASLTSLIKQCPRLKLIHVFGCSSLRNLAKLRDLNPKLCLEGDHDVRRSYVS
ncbi:uncharacterized protein LOC101862262 isoform X2 [Aplysia californica]|uniref:Uncharacterized protein LOC101862262 isoform X2 n=1 Tax=Aplysia californica TaxID=6500 RepID=A0ABM0JKR3_APLCA|nr:uncharacterized protein LOC101862262 isoform X2 [Aplysia californica]